MNAAAESLFDGCLDVNPAVGEGESILKLPCCKGVVLFTDAGDKPVQLLITSNIRSVVHNRLYPSRPGAAIKRAKLCEIVRRVYHRCCYCDFVGSLTLYRIAKILYPDTYQDVVTFARLWFITVHPAGKWPFFSVTRTPFGQRETEVFGPFPARTAAAEFADILEQSFGLCRRPKLIDNPAKAASCPYLQMQTCPAPCVGKISRAEYLQRIADAISAAAAGPEQLIVGLKDKMQRLAAQMRFEQAGAIKNHLLKLAKLKESSFRWVCDITRLAILHIDRSRRVKVPGRRRKIQTFAAFLIKAGQIHELADFTIEQTGKLHTALTEKPASSWNIQTSRQFAEQLSLGGYFLYRHNRPGVWIDCREPPASGDIEAAIRERFGLAVEEH